MWPVLEDRRVHRAAVPLLLLVSAGLALSSLRGDSVTFDEPSHLMAGYSYLRTGDFRMAPDHPPLAKVWAAWPLLLTENRWPAENNAYWVDGNTFEFGRDWLFRLGNDGQRLVVAGRLMMVLLLLALCASTYALGRAVFGPGAGLLALALAALSPTLLAHGRLVTTDLPIALCGVLVLLAFTHLAARPTWWRVIVAGLALAAAAVTKMSWPLLVPALVVMAALTVFEPRPIERPTRRPAGAGQGAAAPGWQRRLGVVGVSALGVMIVAWAGIWTAYGWRRTITPELDPARQSPAQVQSLEQATEKLGFQWQVAMHHRDGTPRRELSARFVELAARTGVLPDAYLLGLAMTLHATSERPSYLMGNYSMVGWRSYFPVAFVIKTPISVLLLLIAGVCALARRRVRPRSRVLWIGMLVFIGVYGAYVISSRFNIGHRHLLPLYPLLFVVAGAAAAWTQARAGRIAIGVLLGWLLGANLWIHPHYLSYFNELIGGPGRGHRYLADSNIDWGQDLLRLADYARAHPAEEIKLAYFGSAVPTAYLGCTALPSMMPFAPPAVLTPGTYVVSVTQLLGVYDPSIRDEFWTADMRRRYGEMMALVARPLPPDAPEATRRNFEQVRAQVEELRRRRLLNHLRKRAPDERIGYSLLVFRINSEAELAALTAP